MFLGPFYDSDQKLTPLTCKRLHAITYCLACTIQPQTYSYSHPVLVLTGTFSRTAAQQQHAFNQKVKELLPPARTRASGRPYCDSSRTLPAAQGAPALLQKYRGRPRTLTPPPKSRPAAAACSPAPTAGSSSPRLRRRPRLAWARSAWSPPWPHLRGEKRLSWGAQPELPAPARPPATHRKRHKRQSTTRRRRRALPGYGRRSLPAAVGPAGQCRPGDVTLPTAHGDVTRPCWEVVWGGRGPRPLPAAPPLPGRGRWGRGSPLPPPRPLWCGAGPAPGALLSAAGPTSASRLALLGLCGGTSAL